MDPMQGACIESQYKINPPKKTENYIIDGLNSRKEEGSLYSYINHTLTFDDNIKHPTKRNIDIIIILQNNQGYVNYISYSNFLCSPAIILASYPGSRGRV